ncbi:MAG TPA: cytochrome c biogenesis protein CcsA [Candidatus Limnocylindria bacterium]|nr:cytochrome c biogenesis protein CcsA [Candidatus Limnocylindria bacterium]
MNLFGTVLLIAAFALLAAAAAAGLAVMLLGSRPRDAALAGGTTTTGPAAAATTAIGSAVVIATALLLAALVMRTGAVGHAPWSNLHEFSIAFAAAVLVVYQLLARSYPITGLAPLAALLAAGLVAFGLSRDDSIQPLVPALQQPLLLTVHVGSAVLAYAVAGVAFIGALGELAQRAATDRLALLPSADVLRGVTHRAVLIGFPILTLAIVLGSVWANLAWRAYWSNDPKELAAAATWLVFGAYLHVAGRRDRLAALAPWLVVLGFAGVLFTYIGAGLFIVGEHSYGAP